MKAVILVAGLGSRLGAITDDKPKCLTEVAGKEILTNTLEILNDLGFSECCLVIGYKGAAIVNRYKSSFKKIKLTYVINEIYSSTSTSYSLLLGLTSSSRTTKEVFVFEGDVFFDKKILEEFLMLKVENSTIVDVYNSQYDGSFVSLSADKRVEDWIHKSRRTADFTIEDKFKTVNIHKFSKTFVEQTLVPYLIDQCSKEGANPPLEYIMQDLILRERLVMHAYVLTGERWFEIDTPEELLIANAIFQDVSSCVV